MKFNFKTIIALVLLVCTTASSWAISNEAERKNLKVYIERAYMDFDYLRRNIAFVDFVNDKEVSDVQIIFNRRRTGSDGWNYTLSFYSNTIESIHDYTLSCFTTPGMSDEDERGTIMRTLKMGLMPFMNESTGSNTYWISKNKRLEKKINNDTIVSTLEKKDPWNNWVVRLDLSGNYDYEESQTITNYNINTRVSRTTDKWKYRIAYITTEKNKEIRKKNSTVLAKNSNTISYGKMVYSINERWSAGGYVNGYSNTYINTGFSATVRSGIEYNLFPWSESHKKLLTLAYYVGPQYKNYFEETQLGFNEQFLVESEIELVMEIIQPWGEIETKLSSEQYLNLDNMYDLSFRTNLSVRLIKGLSVRFHVQAGSIHNQIYLPKKEITDEAQLLGTTKMPTSVEFATGIGVRYQFGSIFNNVINNRMD